MNKNTKNSKNKKIIAATGMTLFSLVAVFTATIAWFASNRYTVYGKGMGVQAAASGIRLSSVEVHKCIANRCTSDVLVFNSTVASYIYDNLLPSQSLTMDDYGELSKNQPVLLLFNLVSPVSATITASTPTTIFGAQANSSNKDSYPLSNVIFFRSSISCSVDTVTGYYNVTNFAGTDQKFVTTIPTSGTSQLTNTLTLYSSGGSSVSSIAIVVDYYEAAIEYIRTNCLTNAIKKLTFTCDWTMKVS